jgi:hypothetical protein
LEALMAASFLFGIVVFALISRTGILGWRGCDVDGRWGCWWLNWRRRSISELIGVDPNQ